MKRGQQFGRYIKGKTPIRKRLKQDTNRAERTEAKRLLRKDPDSLDSKPRRRYWGYDD